MGLNDKFQNMQIHPTDFLIRFVYSPFDPQVKDQSLAKQRCSLQSQNKYKMPSRYKK